METELAIVIFCFIFYGYFMFYIFPSLNEGAIVYSDQSSQCIYIYTLARLIRALQVRTLIWDTIVVSNNLLIL